MPIFSKLYFRMLIDKFNMSVKIKRSSEDRGGKIMRTKTLLLALAICAVSASAFAKKTPKDDFKVVYDEVADITMITHVNMGLKDKGNYNLQSYASTLSECENIRMCIADKSLCMFADYQHNTDWLYMESIVFLDGNGGRLEINNGSRQDKVKHVVEKNAISQAFTKGLIGEDLTNETVVRESYMAILNVESADRLFDILQAEKPTVSFVGKNGRTGKLVIKPKVKDAMLATIEKWRSMGE